MNKLLKTNQEIKEKLKKVNLTRKQRKTKQFRGLLKNFAMTLIRKFQKKKKLRINDNLSNSNKKSNRIFLKVRKPYYNQNRERLINRNIRC